MSAAVDAEEMVASRGGRDVPASYARVTDGQTGCDLGTERRTGKGSGVQRDGSAAGECRPSAWARGSDASGAVRALVRMARHRHRLARRALVLGARLGDLPRTRGR